MDEVKQQNISFNEFELDTAHNRLLRNGKPVSLYAKTFELLEFLVKNNGRVLTKDEILEAVWEGQIVEEANLSVQISALRKALGEKKDSPRFLVTVPGKGYKFIAVVSPGNGKLIIEKHKFSHIVFEEEITNEEFLDEHENEPYSINVKNIPKRPATEKSKTNSNLKRFTAISGLIIIFLFAVGFGSYWFYSKNFFSASPNPANSSQMTVTRITDGRVRNCPSISPDGRFIAFSENANLGEGTLFLHQTDTNTTIQLLEPGERTFGCTNFSPDGSLIYYIVFDKNNPSAALYSIPVIGGTPKRILSNLGSCFTLSPDGTKTAFFRNDAQNKKSGLMIAAVDGSYEKTLLTKSYGEMNFDMGLAWSPDGEQIAFAANPKPKEKDSGTTILAVNVNTSEVKQITSEQYSNMGKMVWTNDGRNLIFVAKSGRKHNKLYAMEYPSGEVRRITNDLENYGNYGLGITNDSQSLVANAIDRRIEIWRVDADGDIKTASRITSGKEDGSLGLTSLPNGEVVYISQTSNSLEIWKSGSEGQEEKSLTTDSYAQEDVVASPDGSHLVFASDQAGESQMFRINAEDGSDIKQLTFDEGWKSQPDVSQDGKWIIYGSSTGQQNLIWKISTESGVSKKLTDYTCFSPVFSPDGKTFACVMLGESLAELSSIAIVSTEGGEPVKTFQVVPFRWKNHVRWTPDGKAVVFETNEQGVTNLWKQPLTGGEPQKLTDFPSGLIWNFTYTIDGKNLLISRGSTFVDVVLIKNFR